MISVLLLSPCPADPLITALEARIRQLQIVSQEPAIV
jgi:hypothetical protein